MDFGFGDFCEVVYDGVEKCSEGNVDEEEDGGCDAHGPVTVPDDTFVAVPYLQQKGRFSTFHP